MKTEEHIDRIAISEKKLMADLECSFETVVKILDDKNCPYLRHGKKIIVHPEDWRNLFRGDHAGIERYKGSTDYFGKSA